MNAQEIRTFIEEIGRLGDEWTEEQVVDAYGDCSLQEALDSRRSDLMIMANILVTVATGEPHQYYEV